MALAAIPPWEAISPFDYINAASSGARLGLERAGQTLNADEAAGRLGLGYAQLASENARAGMAAAEADRRAQAADAFRKMELQASLQQWQQEQQAKQAQAAQHGLEFGVGVEQWGVEQAQKAKAAEDLAAYHRGTLASRAISDHLRLLNTLGVLPKAAKPPAEVKEYTLPDGRKVPYLVSPSGTASWMHPQSLNPPKTGGGLTPYQGMSMRNSIEKQIDALTKDFPQFGDLSGDPNPQWNKAKQDQFNALKKRRAELEKRLQQLDSMMLTPGSDLGTPSNQTPPVDEGSNEPGSFKVGDYTVTPLP